MQFDSRPVVVYGIRVANSEIASLVRRVLIFSSLAALVVIVLTVLNFTVFKDRTTVAQTIISCLVGVSIPVIGWLGAKASNRNLVGVFCSFSLTCALFNLISYILIMSSAAVVDKYLDQCLPDGTVVIDGSVNTNLCHDYTHQMIRDIYIICSCVSLPVIVLQCIGGVYGNSLYSKLTPDIIVAYQSEAYVPGQAYVTGSPVVTVPSPETKGQYTQV